MVDSDTTPGIILEVGLRFPERSSICIIIVCDMLWFPFNATDVCYQILYFLVTIFCYELFIYICLTGHVILPVNNGFLLPILHLLLFLFSATNLLADDLRAQLGDILFQSKGEILLPSSRYSSIFYRSCAWTQTFDIICFIFGLALPLFLYQSFGMVNLSSQGVFLRYFFQTIKLCLWKSIPSLI